jgi:hypothetical protein
MKTGIFSAELIRYLVKHLMARKRCIDLVRR